MIIENEDRWLLDETKRDPHAPIIHSSVCIYKERVFDLMDQTPVVRAIPQGEVS